MMRQIIATISDGAVEITFVALLTMGVMAAANGEWAKAAALFSLAAAAQIRWGAK